MAASPTLRRRRLARELLRLREEAGLTAKQAAKEAKTLSPERPWFEAKITRIETRKILRVRDVDLQTLLDVYKVRDTQQREAYRKLAREAAQSGWWIGYKDVLGNGAYVDLETEASCIRTYQVLYIPGLLQTEQYARALIKGGSLIEEQEVERRVEARMVRQHILQRADAPQLWVVIDESAFRKTPAEVARKQLDHLLAMHGPSVRIQILPDEVGPHAGMEGSFVIMDFTDDLSTVYLEQSISAIFAEEPAEVEHYGLVYDHLQTRALSVEASRKWMQQRRDALTP